MAEVLSETRRRILDFISNSIRERDFPPTIREICAEVGLAPATVQKHVEVLAKAGYLKRDAQQARTLSVRTEASSEPASISSIRQVPLLGDVAAGTGVLAQESEHELLAIPEQFAGRGESFMLQVRGESMIDAGILPGDFVVVQRQQTANVGEIVVAGIPGEEATVKRYFPQGSRVVLKPENSTMEPMDFDANEVQLYGRVISVLRSYR
jgi:repressor LexA